MTVAELIAALQALDDQTLPVCYQSVEQLIDHVRRRLLDGNPPGVLWVTEAQWRDLATMCRFPDLAPPAEREDAPTLYGIPIYVWRPDRLLWDVGQ